MFVSAKQGRRKSKHKKMTRNEASVSSSNSCDIVANLLRPCLLQPISRGAVGAMAAACWLSISHAVGVIPQAARLQYVSLSKKIFIVPKLILSEGTQQ